ncbi:MMPL family transporter [Omnitrophica bacterium]|nr:MMPL family transporter [Candidatus Omnitrophota bacterium]
MNLLKKLTSVSLLFPKLTIALVSLLALASVFFFPRIHIDTDPENMLSEQEFVRVFHHEVKKEFDLHDIIVLGVVNESHANGVFNPATLQKVYAITQEILKIDGVIAANLISPSTVDNIRQAGQGAVSFNWLMGSPKITAEQAAQIRSEAKDNPMLDGTLVSEDGKALAIYVPVQSKDMSYRVSTEIRKILKKYPGPEAYHITGLPVAEDTFGIEMFKQMAVSAPLAGLIIFLLLWYFFKKLSLIISPMITAIFTVLVTMGLLIGMGHTVHIMSSMIPIFLMPIAVVDSIHILSEFYDRYPVYKDKRKTIESVMDHLFVPMFFTTVTSAVGFASLAFTPIPPVQVFGMFVAGGIFLAWVFTVTFIPASTLLIPEKRLQGFGLKSDEGEPSGPLHKILQAFGAFAVTSRKPILGLTLLVMAVSVAGILRIQINDNPVKWFRPDHSIRVADRVLNEHFGGTYTAYLVLEADEDQAVIEKRWQKFLAGAPARKSGAYESMVKAYQAVKKTNPDASYYELVNGATEAFYKRMEQANGWDLPEWSETLDYLEAEQARSQTFKDPTALRTLEALQKELLKTGVVGKSTSAADLVKKIHYELREGNKKYDRIPATAQAVAQVYLSFQNSHKPDDLWHLVTPDYAKANVWIQLKSGDNKDMEKVVKAVDAFMAQKPGGLALRYNWAGLTYINTVWQEKMVFGMLKSLLGSFIIVALLMMFLFRSVSWGLLSMIPLTVTITFIYGMIGWIGKDYDMPVAVLSSLTLGLSIDFAIHFIQRARELYREKGDLKETFALMYAEPARAITRNAIVITIGFLPLLAAPLVPYQTVGIFISAIMAVSAFTTLLVLPSLICVTKLFGGKCQ